MEYRLKMLQSKTFFSIILFCFFFLAIMTLYGEAEGQPLFNQEQLDYMMNPPDEALDFIVWFLTIPLTIGNLLLTGMTNMYVIMSSLGTIGTALFLAFAIVIIIAIVLFAVEIIKAVGGLIPFTFYDLRIRLNR